MIPTIEVVRSGIHLVFKEKCKHCNKKHLHGAGGYDTPFGFGNGHRSAHCDGYPQGYIIREVEP